MTLIPVILAGGVGARLWPVSRELHPKPFMRLADGQSLLQKAFIRAASLPDVAEICTVSNRDLYFKAADEFRAVNAASLSMTYLLEPCGRNTAPAMAVAALQIVKKHSEEAVLLVLPADHLISDQTAFAKAVAAAVQLANGGYLVTFGITPKSAETGYGYIEVAEDGIRVRRFVEKPSREVAEKYLSSGRYLWNSGMFCCRADVLIEQLAEHAPQVLSAARNSLAAAFISEGIHSTQIALDPACFACAPDISIDYALMEHSSRVAVIACDPGWSDIGSWSALGELTPADKEGNAIFGEALLHGSSDCFIHSPERMVAAVGLSNLIIVDTPDALLVAARDRVQEVRQIVAQLKEKNHDAYKLHREVHRPWGEYTILGEGEGFKIKRIQVKPGASLSLQMHRHRSEHWIVVNGTASVINGADSFLVCTNESTFIPAGHKHRLANFGAGDLVIIEVQSGEYLGEDDIVRFDDCYDRATG